MCSRNLLIFLKLEVVHSIVFTITMIFKHFRASFGANDRFTFLYSNFNCVFFFIKQHCFSFYGKLFDERE